MPESTITRLFDLRRDGVLSDNALALDLMQPIAQPTGEWGCNVTIRNDATVLAESVAFGEDPLQALLLGVRVARALLYDVSRMHGWQILWLGQEDLGLRTGVDVFDSD